LIKSYQYRHYMRAIFALIFGLSIITFTQAQKVDLSLNLQEGKTYTQASESKISIKQVINGQDIEMGMALKGSMSYLVRTATKEDYVMEIMYETLSISMELPQGGSVELPQGGSVEFSSEKTDENDIMSTVLRGITEQAFTLVLGRKGTISEISDLDTVWTSVFSQFPNVPEDQLNQVKGQIKNAFGPEALKGNIEMVTAIFPQDRVEPGEEWKVNTSMQSGISVDVATTYKLAELHPDYYLITGESSLHTADTAAIVDTNGMPMKYNLTGAISSEIKIDKQSGWIIEAHNIQDIEGEAQIQPNPQVPMSMSIPMIMKNETVIKGY